MKNWGITAVSIAVVAILGYLAYTDTSISDLVYTAKNTAALVISATPTPSTAGKLTVSAVSSKTNPRDVGAGATEFTFAEFAFDAKKSDEDIAVSSITLTPVISKKGNASDLAQCQISKEGSRMYLASTGVLIPNQDITFDLSGKLSIPKGTVQTMAIRCSVTVNPKSVSGSTFSFKIKKLPDGVKATGLTSGGATKITLSSANGPTITLRTNGELKVVLDSSTPKASKVACGQSKVKIAKFKISAMYEGIILNSLRFALSGTAIPIYDDRDVVSFTLYDDIYYSVGVGVLGGGSKKTTTSTIDRLLIIPKGGQRILTLTANILSSEYPACQPGKTLGIDYNGYFDAIGATSGSRIPVSNSAKTSAPKITLIK